MLAGLHALQALVSVTIKPDRVVHLVFSYNSWQPTLLPYILNMLQYSAGATGVPMAHCHRRPVSVQMHDTSASLNCMHSLTAMLGLKALLFAVQVFETARLTPSQFLTKI